ncbi:WG repeat-containing protein [Flammeovirga agarivorans]|uniref:WG repeat-containing protein n=1 Tax=Flammeovirga agarivorans TaxID=2726742 RepID=A0A7X8SH78_9BACT|nr:WG repeat-containing protein [Flammeovirga agarivorans]NLR90072.1 WG repeat-containing protein [Flammeovirga agarivorans]
MLKPLLILLNILIFPFYITAQSLIPVSDQGKWGLVTEDNSEIVSPKYQYITPILKGSFYRFGFDNKTGLMDNKGKEIIPPVYERLEVLDHNLFVIWNSEGCSLINQKQEKLTKENYYSISPFGSYLKVFHKNKVGLINKNGEVIISPKFDDIQKKQHIYITESNNKKGFLNLKGEEQVSPQFKSVEFLDNNHIICRIEGGPLVQWFTIEESGTVINEKSFNKDTDYKRYQKELYLSAEINKVINNAPVQPVWVDVQNEKYLIAPNGKILMGGKSFFFVQYDPNSNLSVARRQESEDVYMNYLIDMTKGTTLFNDTFKEIVLSDFNSSEWARISVDTLWDKLINKKGTVKRQATVQGNDYTFNNIGNFYEKRAWFSTKDYKYGLIDDKAEVVVKPIYSVITDFTDGQAIVKRNNLYGTIDVNGEIILPIEYNGVSKLNNGWMSVKKGPGTAGRWGIFDKTGHQILDFKYEKIYLDEKGANVFENGRWGRYLRTKKWAFQPSIKVNEMLSFKNGIAKLQRKPIYNPVDRITLIGFKYQGYIKEDGTVIIPPVYTDIIGFERAWEKQEGLGILKKGELVGYINYLGETVLEPKYIKADGFSEVWTLHKGVAMVETKNKYINFVDYHGDEVLPEEFSAIDQSFYKIAEDSSGVSIGTINRKKGLLDYQGNHKSPFVYQQLYPINDQRFIAQKDKLWGIINADGDTLSSFINKKSSPLKGTENIKFLKDSTSSFSISNDGTWGIANLKVTPIQPSFKKIDDYKYHHIGSDYAIVSKKGKSKLQGVIDPNGKILVKLEFKKISPFTGDLAPAQKDSKNVKERKYGYINKKGKWIIAPTYNHAKQFSNGLAAVCSKNKWGYIDANGKVVIPIKYSTALDFKGELAEVDHHFIINKKGLTVGELKDHEQLYDYNGIRGIVKGTGYQRHILPNGIAAYAMKFDEVTPYNNAGVAFVKTGEIWELTRKINKTTTKKRFTKFQMENYLEQYGNKRKVVSLTGDVSQDMGFEKIHDGTWRMIGLDGTPLNPITFEKVKYDQGVFTFHIKQLEKVVNQDGKELTDWTLGIISTPNGKIISFQNGGSKLIQ